MVRYMGRENNPNCKESVLSTDKKWRITYYTLKGTSMYSIGNSKTHKRNAKSKYCITSLDENNDKEFFICSSSDVRVLGK